MKKLRVLKRTTAFLLAAVFVFGLFDVSPALSAWAVTGVETPAFSDMPDNWSTAALQNAVANGLLKGSDGKIMPNDNLTRAQMAIVIVRAFGAVTKGDISSFTDVNPTDWFANDIAKAYQMGVIKGANGQMNPKSAITRQEVFVVIARALKLEPAETIDKTFYDLDDLADWAKGEVYALINAGYIQGSNGKLNPTGHITRAEFAQVMDNIIKQYINQASEITDVADGNIMVNVPSVTLKDVTVNGDLIIGDGVGDGEVILENVNVTGRMVIRGGGENSIIIRGSSNVSNIIVSRINGIVSVKVEGDADVDIIYIDDDSDDVFIEGMVGSLEVSASDIMVTAAGASISSASISGTNTTIIINDESTVGEMTVEACADNSTIEVAGSVTMITTAAPGTNITGEGSVGEVDVQEGADGSSILTPNTIVTVQPNVTGVTGGGGTSVEGGSTVTNNEDGSDIIHPSSDDGGGGSIPSLGVSDVSAPGSTTIEVTMEEKTEITFTWNGTVLDAADISYSTDKYILTVPAMTSGESNTLVISRSGYSNYTNNDVVWLDEYTVTFEDYDGTELKIENVLHGYDATAPSDPARVGYMFTGWDTVFTNVISDLTVTAEYLINRYTITFDSAGGSTVDSITQDYNTTVTPPTPPTRDGYDFNGWSPAVPGTMPAENITLTAQWTLVTYSITYNLDGGMNYVDAPASYNVESETITLGSPTKTGCTFAGWFDAESGGTQVTSIPQGSTGNVTLYAYWTINQYTITFDSTGGSAVDSITQDYNTTVTPPIPPTRDGYDFDGWSPAVPGTMPAENITLTAQWTLVTYSITYNLDGGMNYVGAPASYNVESETITLGSPTKTGCTFAGWFDAESGGTQVTSIPQGSTGNVTLYAYWTINQYTITFDSAGGSAVDSITQDYNTTVTPPTPPTRDGYDFDGWSPAVPGTMPAENITLTAQWTLVTYSITYNLDGGMNYVGAPASYNVESETITLGSPTKTGCTFAGWFDAESGGTQVTSIPQGSTGNVTLYAYWTINQYTITFDSAGGSAVDSITQDYNTTVTSPTPPTRDGYDFDGWSPAVPGTMPAENITLTAQWTLVTYSITYNLDGGMNYVGAPASYNVESETITLGSPTKTGCTFAGWFDAESGGTQVTSIPQGSTGNVTLYAYWTINQYTITFDSTGGSAVDSITQDYNTTVTPPIPPTRDGYDFDGWSPAVPGTMPAENITLTAQWTLVTYSITYNLDGGMNYVGAPASYNVESETITLGSPTKTGCTFAGWFDAESGGTQVTSIPQGSTGNVTLYAYWTINQYTLTITYVMVDETTPPDAYVDSLDYQASYSINSPEVAGYNPNQAIVSGTMPAENVSVTVTYYFACAEGTLLAADGGTDFTGVLYARDGNIYYNQLGSTGIWGVEALIDVGTTGSFAIDASGHPHVAYTASDGTIGYRMFDGSAWTDAVFIASNNGGICSKPDIDVDGSGYAHITYTDTQGNTFWYINKPDIMYATNTSGVFVNQVIFDGYYESYGGASYGGVYYNWGSKITIDEGGNYYIMAISQSYYKYMGGSDSSYTIQVKSSLSDSTGSSTTEYSNVFGIYDLKADAGKVLALYKQTGYYTAELTVSGSFINFTNAAIVSDTVHSIATDGMNIVVSGLSGSYLQTVYNGTTNVLDTITPSGTTSVINFGGTFYAVYTDSTDGTIKLVEVTAPVQTATPVIATGSQSVGTETITIEGTSEANAVITITGGAAPASGMADAEGAYSVEVSLTADSVNILSVTAQAPGKTVSAAATVDITHVTAPASEHLTPIDGATDVVTDAQISVQFDCDVTQNDLSGVIITYEGDETQQVPGVSAVLNGRVLTISHEDLLSGTVFTVTVPADAVINAGGGNELITWSFTTAAPGAEIVIDTPLQMGINTTAMATTTEPGAGNWISDMPSVAAINTATGVITANSQGSAIISYTTSTSGKVNSIEVYVYSAPSVMEDLMFFDGTTEIYSGTKQLINFMDLSEGKTRTIIVEDGTSDVITVDNDGLVTYVANGAKVVLYELVETATGRVIEYGAVTITAMDAPAPALSWTDPTDGGTGILTTYTIRLMFEENVVEVDLSQITITYNDGVDFVSIISVAIDEADPRTIEIIHDEFNTGTVYTVNIPADTVRNTAGTGNDAMSWSFTTLLPT